MAWSGRQSLGTSDRRRAPFRRAGASSARSPLSRDALFGSWETATSTLPDPADGAAGEPELPPLFEVDESLSNTIELPPSTAVGIDEREPAPVRAEEPVESVRSELGAEEEPRAVEAPVQAAAPVPGERDEDEGPAAQAGPNLDLILGVSVPVSVRLAELSMTMGELLSLNVGSVVDLGRSAEGTVDLCVRDVRFGRGEVVVVDNNFGLRVTELSAPGDRLGGLSAA